MFIMLDVRACGLPAAEFAERLLEEEDVSVLPTESFGPSGHGHVRISLADARGAPRRGLRAHRALRRGSAGPGASAQLMRASRSPHSRSRRTYFCTLPVEVFGSGPNSTASGAL